MKLDKTFKEYQEGHIWGDKTSDKEFNDWIFKISDSIGHTPGVWMDVAYKYFDDTEYEKLLQFVMKMRYVLVQMEIDGKKLFELDIRPVRILSLDAGKVESPNTTEMQANIIQFCLTDIGIEYAKSFLPADTTPTRDERLIKAYKIFGIFTYKVIKWCIGAALVLAALAAGMDTSIYKEYVAPKLAAQL